MLIKQLFIALLLGTLTACAGSNSDEEVTNVDDERDGSDCIFRASIRGYSVLDESNLIVEGSSRRNYHVTLSRRAIGLRSSHAISFDSATSRICAPFSELIYGGRIGGGFGGIDGGKVRIATIRQLSPEEHEELLIRYGKKEPEIEQAPVPAEVNGAEVEELDPAADGN